MGAVFYRKGILISILISSISLSIGMMLLTYVTRFAAFVGFTGSYSISLTLLIYLIFSVVCTSIWNIFFRKFMNYLRRIDIKEIVLEVI